jgi:nitrilase
MLKVAIVQHTPCFLDLERGLRLACDCIAEAAQNGAALVVLSEAFLPGYPAWIWRLRPGPDAALLQQLHARLLAQAVNLDGNALDPLRAAAAAHGVTVVCGVVERDGAGSRSTLYNAVVVIGPDGALLNRHRKLVPTNVERTVWGQGDASGLRAVETPAGRLGTLICWESYMPLARYALFAQGIDVYIAPSYDCGDAWVGSLQHIAREGRCWVLGCGMAFQAGALPDDFPGRAQMYPDAQEWVNAGDSLVVAPDGTLVAGPLRRAQGILYADIDLARSAQERRSLDVAGHYARPDIFDLRVNCAPAAPVTLFDARQS